MPRFTALACTGLAVAGLGLFTAAAGADAASPAQSTTWSKTYTLKSNGTKTYRLQLPAGYEKASGRYAINYSLSPVSGPGFAVGNAISGKGGKQKPYLGARVVKTNVKSDAVIVKVRTAKLQRALALQINASGTADKLGANGQPDTPIQINVSGVPTQQLVYLQFDQQLYYDASNQSGGTPEFVFQGQNARLILPNEGIVVGGSSSPLSAQLTAGVVGNQVSGTAQIPAGATVTISIGGAAPVTIPNGAFNVG